MMASTSSVAGTSGNLVEGNTSASPPAVRRPWSTAPAAWVSTVAPATTRSAGPVSGSANVISGNAAAGLYISGAETSDNVVAGDFIGTNYTGTIALPNVDGVLIQSGAENNTIGALTVGAASNVISGNSGDNLDIVGSGTSGNVVEGNYIGLAVGGNAALDNGASGVGIYGGATNNTIGGTVSGARNVISGNDGNGSSGVYLTTRDDRQRRRRKLHRYQRCRHRPVPNHLGVLIQNGAVNNTIGALTVGSPSNVISGNTTDGVEITGSGTSGNVVEGNYIGLKVGGAADLDNAQSGVAILGGASNNTIGGTAAGALT